MGQAILIKTGFAGGNGGNGSGNNNSEDQNITGWQVKTNIITTNGYFSVPKAKDQEFHVRIFGGGGGGYIGGGGGGNMNNDTLILNQGESIQVSIGAAGSVNGVGGTTSFGTYLSATGGQCGGPKQGGNGGTGGGGVLEKTTSSSQGYKSYSTGYMANGGSGTYGGGGGGSFSANDGDSVSYCYGGKGGTYGGDGYGGSNGTNTLSMTELDFVGEGKARNSNSGSGSGGYGGDGGYNLGGGGGGYGGNGGNSMQNVYRQNSASQYVYDIYTHWGYGGGGGYGGKGGDGYATSSAGYGGGGGGYGPSNYGAGGRGDNGTGKAGVCIITYQAPIYKN